MGERCRLKSLKKAARTAGSDPLGQRLRVKKQPEDQVDDRRAWLGQIRCGD
jgi:hypothetical protein